MLFFLIGFMGSGKSYTGKQISATLDIPLVDMDSEIENREGKSINDIFEEHGEFHFRELEKKYLESLEATETKLIATGGGVPCFNENIQLMNRLGTTIFIDAEKEVIIERLLEGIEDRPLLKGMNQLDLEFFYDEKMKERRQLYELANFHCRHQDISVITQLVKSLT